MSNRNPIAVAIGSRANYGSLKSAMVAMRERGMDVRPVAFASATDARYGNTADRLQADGFNVEYCLPGHVDGAMGITAAVALQQWVTVIGQMKPRAVVVVGDRHEVLAPATAAAYCGVTLVHTMGGEVSGCVDDKVRNAISALADVSCVATEMAGERLRSAKIGGVVHVTGCPRIDLARQVFEQGVELGDHVVVSLHPDTNESDEYNREMMHAVLEWARTQETVHFFWPNSDTGSVSMVEVARGMQVDKWAKTHRKMGPEEYMRMLCSARLCVGNSSSFLREGAFLGVPAVLIGNRQWGRERADNTETWHHDWQNGVPTMESMVDLALEERRYESSTLYGDGHSGARVAEIVGKL